MATLLATLPGLPMFGHGQVEGYSEQYGMEFRRPQRDETPNEGLVARHRREIFPLLRQRWRFAGAGRASASSVAIDDAGRGRRRLRLSRTGPRAGQLRRRGAPLARRLPQSLPASAHVRIAGVADALGLGDDPEGYLILRDQRSGLQYLRQLRGPARHGLELSLDGYACHVFLGFEEVSDAGGRGLGRARLRLGLAGVEDAHAALARLRDEPLARGGRRRSSTTPTAQAAFLPAAAGTAEPIDEEVHCGRSMPGPLT